MSDRSTTPVTVPPVNDPRAIAACLAMHTIAVVGLSDQPARTSNRVAAYMQAQGYTIIPVNPQIREALGVRAYPSLAAIDQPFALVNVFRRSEFVAGVVDEAIAAGAQGLWTQLGVIDYTAAERARRAGLVVVMDRCLMVERAARGGTG